MAKDYYEILGVSKNASKEDIKKAYKKLAKQYHPDINKEAGAADRFKEINEAYSVLGNDDKRSNYDRFGSAEQFGQGFNGFRGFGDFSFEDAFDIFNSFFGGNPFSSRRRRQSRGADIAYKLNISFDEAAFGTEKRIEVPRDVKCNACNGTGAENGELRQCPNCNGSGIAKKMYRTPFGVISQSSTCTECNGEGHIAKNKCAKCNGQGIENKKKVITITIPAGVDNGSTLRLENEGEAGMRGAPSGNLYIELNVEPHKIFERQGNDLYLEYPISFSQAALGAEVKIPTLKGEINMKIPAGTQTNTIFRLKAKGIPYLDGHGYGDEHVRVIVQTPIKLNKKQKELMKELAKDEPKPKLKKDKNFFEKVREVFL